MVVGQVLLSRPNEGCFTFIKWLFLWMECGDWYNNCLWLNRMDLHLNKVLWPQGSFPCVVKDLKNCLSLLVAKTKTFSGHTLMMCKHRGIKLQSVSWLLAAAVCAGHQRFPGYLHQHQLETQHTSLSMIENEIWVKLQHANSTPWYRALFYFNFVKCRYVDPLKHMFMLK